MGRVYIPLLNATCPSRDPGKPPRGLDTTLVPRDRGLWRYSGPIEMVQRVASIVHVKNEFGWKAKYRAKNCDSW